MMTASSVTETDLVKIRTLLSHADHSVQQQGLELAKSLGDWSPVVQGCAIDEDGKISVPFAPLNSAVLELFLTAPETVASGITKLNIRKFPLQSVEVLTNLTALTDLNLSSCKFLENVDELSTLTALTTLNLGGCESLQSLDGLAGCTELSKLVLRGCESLQNLDGLTGCTGLSKLVLKGCEKLSNLDALRDLNQLAVLVLSDCHAIENVKALSSLKSLRSLVLDNLEVGKEKLLDSNALAQSTALFARDTEYPVDTSLSAALAWGWTSDPDEILVALTENSSRIRNEEEFLHRGSAQALSIADIEDIVVVMSTRALEHYEYSIACDAPQVDAELTECWHYGEHYFQYRGNNAFRRLLEDGICHAVWDEESLFDQYPSQSSSGARRLFSDLSCDKHESIYIECDTSYEDFYVTPEAEDVMTADGYNPMSASDLNYYSGQCFVEKPIIGISAFGIRFKDGTVIGGCSAGYSEGQRTFRRTMEHFSRLLYPNPSTSNKLTGLLCDRTTHTTEGLALAMASSDGPSPVQASPSCRLVVGTMDWTLEAAWEEDKFEILCRSFMDQDAPEARHLKSLADAYASGDDPTDDQLVTIARCMAEKDAQYFVDLGWQIEKLVLIDDAAGGSAVDVVFQVDGGLKDWDAALLEFSEGRSLVASDLDHRMSQSYHSGDYGTGSISDPAYRHNYEASCDELMETLDQLKSWPPQRLTFAPNQPEEQAKDQTNVPPSISEGSNQTAPVSFSITNGQQALLAIAIVIEMADGTPTTTERETLYQTVAHMPLFSGSDRDTIQALAAKITSMISCEFATAGTGALAAEDMEKVFGLAAVHLSVAEKEAAYKLAMKVADSDTPDGGAIFNVGTQEILVLNLLRRALGLEL